jgi:hypothetical protein
VHVVQRTVALVRLLFRLESHEDHLVHDVSPSATDLANTLAVSGGRFPMRKMNTWRARTGESRICLKDRALARTGSEDGRDRLTK